MAKSLVIYEGAMCCSTGLCGPEPDKTMVEFNEAIKKIQANNKDLSVVRASMSFNIQAFFQNMVVFQKVRMNGPGILPITTVDGKIILERKYPTYDELVTGIAAS